MDLNINVQEMDEILKKLAEIINLYSVSIQDECSSLAALDYYRAGQAEEIFNMYGQILDKMQEAGDMYYLAYRLAAQIEQEMTTLDALMAGLLQGNTGTARRSGGGRG